MKTTKPDLQLSGIDGNAFMLLGKARKVALANGLNWDAIATEAQSGNYDHLLATLFKHFNVT